MDLVPSLAAAFFAGRLPATLSAGQAAILLSLGLQQHDVAGVEKVLGLPQQQLLALFNKAGSASWSLHPACILRGEQGAVPAGLEQARVTIPRQSKHEGLTGSCVRPRGQHAALLRQSGPTPDRLGVWLCADSCTCLDQEGNAALQCAVLCARL